MMKPNSSLTHLWPLILIAAGLAVYWPGLGGGFIFDDYPNLVDSPDWKVTSLHWQDWQTAIGQGISSDAGRPLALLSFAINHYFTGMDPAPMKATGLGLHVLNSLLVFLLCRQLFAAAAARSPAARVTGFAALVVALAWLLHPLQVSSVLYVVQRMEVGAHTGVLVALIAYLHGRMRQQRGERAWPWFLLAGGGTLFGVGFKESALLIPGYTLFLEACVLRFRTKGDQRSRGLLALYAAGALSALVVFLIVILPPYLAPEAYAFRDFTLIERLLTQPRVLASYLGQILLPLPDALFFYYDHIRASTGLVSPPATLGGVVLLVALLAGAVAARHRWPLVSLGLCWFLVAHALTSNVVPLELAFEHRNYFAMLGIFIAVTQVLSWAGRRLSLEAGKAMAALPLLLLAFLCSIQVHTWGDPFRLALALGSRNTDSERALLGAAAAMLEQSHHDPQSLLFQMARGEFQNAAALPGSSPLGEQAQIIMLAKAGQPVPAALWASFRTKLQRRDAGPQEIDALYSVLSCRMTGQCKFDEQELFDTLATAVQQNPNSPTVVTIYANFAFNVMQDTDLAIRMVREASRLAPDDLQHKINLAKFLTASGKHPDELLALRREIEVSDRSGYYRRVLDAPLPPGPVSRSD